MTFTLPIAAILVLYLAVRLGQKLEEREQRIRQQMADDIAPHAHGSADWDWPELHAEDRLDNRK
jgi:hypothetical protein